MKIIDKLAKEMMKYDVLEAMKSILGITDLTLDTLLNYAINRAKVAILTYTGWEGFNDERYVPALISLAISYYNHDKFNADISKGKQIKASQTQGSRSETYVTSIKTIDPDGLTEDVRAMLPLPKLKVY